MNQLELHKKIKEILGENPDDVEKEKVLELMPEGNFDAKNYFFVNADERWAEWLWENDFLDILKKQPEDITKYSYATSEINYVRDVVGKDISSDSFVVNKIILDENIATSDDKFNPELIDQVLRICSGLPVDLLIKVIPKIKKQNWVKLMSSFGQWGFEYEKMFETLHKTGKIDELIDLAEVVLSVKSKEEIEEKYITLGSGKKILSNDTSPFHIRDFSYTKVFEYLGKIEGENNKEKVLKLLTDVAVKIAILGKENDKKESAFKIRDTFHLYDVDFFNAEDIDTRHISYRDSVKELMLNIANLTKDLIGKNCGGENETKVKEIFDKYIGNFDDEGAKLPDTRAVWQLRLFVLSLCPKAFKEEIKKSLFRLFGEEDRYVDIKSGAEYEQLLKSNFNILDSDDQKTYEEEVIKLFKSSLVGKTEEQQGYIKRSGAKILCLIGKKEKAKEVFGFDCDTIDIEPRATITGGHFAHSIVSQPPMTQEEFDKKSIDEILELLQNEWTPEKLNEQNESKDFHRPRNAEGAGGLLEKSVGNDKKFKDFIKNAEKFFDKGKIDEHYIHSFLRGIQEAIKNGKRVDNDDWKPLVNFLNNLVNANLEKRERKEGYYDTWLANWQSVYYVMTDVLQELLSEKNGEAVIGDFEKYRDNLLHILEFLLRYKNDPKPEDEKTKSAKSTTSGDNGDMVISDPYSMAINSVRGRAFQAFLMFVYQDGKKLENEEIKIKLDIKDLFEEILKEENTRTMMFMYGHHLPTFYFRDKEWTKKVLISQIFEGEKNEYLKLASIEGYLTQTLYKEIFEDGDFEKMYEKWIELENTKYPNQKHHKAVDEALAIHLALAFINFDVDIESELLEKFWKIQNKNNQTRHHEFVSFVGRDVLSRDKASILAKEKEVILKKAEKFWDWALENLGDKKVLAGFGYWINPNIEVLGDNFVIEKIAETLKKSEGDIDWDYGLIQRLVKFAEIDSENTLLIIERYLLNEEGEVNQNRRVPMFSIDKEIKKALEIIYQKPDLKEKVKDLINNLIQKGSSAFWGLEDILG